MSVTRLTSTSVCGHLSWRGRKGVQHPDCPSSIPDLVAHCPSGRPDVRKGPPLRLRTRRRGRNRCRLSNGDGAPRRESSSHLPSRYASERPPSGAERRDWPVGGAAAANRSHSRPELPSWPRFAAAPLRSCRGICFHLLPLSPHVPRCLLFMEIYPLFSTNIFSCFTYFSPCKLFTFVRSLSLSLLLVFARLNPLSPFVLRRRSGPSR